MRTQRRNLKTVYYAYPTGKNDTRDDDGNLTGEYTLTYSTPLPLKANVGIEGGNVHLGNYNVAVASGLRTLVSDEIDANIPEDSVFGLILLSRGHTIMYCQNLFKGQSIR